MPEYIVGYDGKAAAQAAIEFTRVLHINWDQVAFIGPNRTAEALGGAAHRSSASPVRTRAAPAHPQA